MVERRGLNLAVHPQRRAATAAWVIFVCTLIYGVLDPGYRSANAQGAPPPSPAVSVVAAATQQVTETGKFIGRVTAINKVDIVARVSGFIEKRYFTEGQQVKKGDALFLIEQATYKAAVEQEQANLARSKATEVNAALQLQRGKELIRDKLAMSQSVFDQREADAAAAKASILQAQAQLDQATVNLGYTEIHSPIDGRIGIANLTEGNLVSPNTGVLATIVSQDPIYVTFQASERDVLAYKRRIAESADKDPHVTVHITLADGTEYAHPGITNLLDVQVDAATDTVAVRAQVPNPEGLLIAGGVVGVTVDRGKPKSLLVIPQSAIQLDQVGRYVLVVDTEKKVEQRRITTGADQGRGIVVTGGLKEGELVIVDGVQKVHPGQVVTVSVVTGN